MMYLILKSLIMYFHFEICKLRDYLLLLELTIMIITLSNCGIVNECIKNNVKRLVFTSTLLVYGHGDGGIFDENQILKPIDPYGLQKWVVKWISKLLVNNMD